MIEQMRTALLSFNAAGERIENFYRTLSSEVYRLTQELETSNRELRRKVLEKEKMQAILLSTLQSLTVGAVAVAKDGVVMVANPAACRLLGHQLEELAGRQVEEILNDVPDADVLLLTLQGAGGEQRKTHWTPEGRDPMSRWIELTAVRALPPYDQHLAGLILLEDQTELRRFEAQAKLQSRLAGMGEIAMNLAHEIRNPLGSIALFATALERELEDDESLGPLAGQIVAGVKSLDHLVGNTLEFARPRRMSMSRVNLTEAISDTLVYIEHPLREKSIQLTCDTDMHPEAWIVGDAEQLRQVFLNMAINAIQAMNEGGTLEIRLFPAEGGGWTMELCDDGVGIPEEMIEKIFDPFFTTKEKGSGIGLAVVHRVLEAHEARIEVESTVPVGTTFRVTFPAVRRFEGIN